MDQSKIEETIREYLPQIIHMSLATCIENKPWVCEVHFAWDDDLNIYFCSSYDRRHSEELRKNPQVAGNIVTQHAKHQTVRGVYFEGIAEQLEQIDESHPGFIAYTKRFGAGPHTVQAAKSEGKARFYKISVNDFYLFDGYTSDPAQKFHLAWNSKK